MTVVNFDFADPAGVPVKGYVSLVPTRRVTVGDEVRLPTALRVRLEAGEASVELMPSTTQWVWRVAELVPGGITRYVAVPNSELAVEYADLESVDPSSLDVSSASVPAWEIATRTTQEMLDKVGEIDGKVERAEDAAAGAESSVNKAKSHENAAKYSADAAASSARDAASNATAAESSASQAQSSATAAASSAHAASTSAESAKTVSDSATSAKDAAAQSASEASASAQEAETSETNAASSASAAKVSETNAAESATAAASSETNAATSATAAQNAVDGFGLEVGTTTTGEPGSDAAVNITKQGTKYVADFTIPKGPQGPKGDPGNLTTVTHNNTLIGGGTSGDPLGVNPYIMLSNGIDFNTVKTFGIYLKVWANTATNTPISDNMTQYLLLVNNSSYRDNGDVIQVIVPIGGEHGATNIYFRYRPSYTTNWNKWKQLLTDNDLSKYVPLSTYKTLEARVQALEAKSANQ